MLWRPVSCHSKRSFSFCELSRGITNSCVHLQSKIHAARSLSEIAIDLTETGTLKTSKLANMGSKGKIISGSSGSLLSSGRSFVLQLGGVWWEGPWPWYNGEQQKLLYRMKDTSFRLSVCPGGSPSLSRLLHKQHRQQPPPLSLPPLISSLTPACHLQPLNSQLKPGLSSQFLALPSLGIQLILRQMGL